jgi:RNA recognition motif-containing protein
MRSQENRGPGRKSGRGPRRSGARSRNDARPASSPPAPKTFWQKLLGFFKPAQKTTATVSRNGQSAPQPASRASRKPESIEVTSPKLYVGNLSYDASESDLFELFKGVGVVKNAEIVTHKYNEKSKGFGFVTMTTTDEAKRAVSELHDKEFMGRKLVVSGAKTSDREPAPRQQEPRNEESAPTTQ